MPPAAPRMFPADAELVRLADQCVMCGLCLPHCPTYRVGRIEAEGPRGRIALARALASGALEPTPSATRHLDQCLGCLSCEVVCPSQVRYGAILDRVRSGQVASGAGTGERADALQRLLHDPVRLTRLARIGAWLRTDRWLPRFARLLPPGPWRRLAEVQPAVPPLPARVPLARTAPARGRIALFRGCVASVHDRDTLAAARHLLEAVGFEVAETGAGCCGALPRHAGLARQADVHAASTRALLRATGADTVLCCASGCFGDLRAAVGDEARVFDVHDFLAADSGFAALRFRALPARAALHRPCTQVNVVDHEEAIARLLARIPALLVTPLPLQPRCCGAAGSYFIEHAAIADALRDEKLDQARALTPDLVLTTNVGCRIHLGNGLRARAANVPVLHPLALLAQQLDNADA